MPPRNAPRGCSDEDSDYCMGVGLQIFLLLLVSTCAMGVYRVCIPMRFCASANKMRCTAPKMKTRAEDVLTIAACAILSFARDLVGWLTVALAVGHTNRPKG